VFLYDSACSSGGGIKMIWRAMCKRFFAKCPFCGVITVIEIGRQKSGCSHYKKMELAHEDKVVAVFQGEWSVVIAEENDENL
jgi:hypothetical protein